MSFARIASWLTVLADPRGPKLASPLRALQPRALDRLVRLADVHGVLPAVRENLGQLTASIGPDRIVQASGETPSPEDQLDEILTAADHELRRRAGLCLMIRRQINELTDAFEKHAVPVAVLKGAEFADRLYPRPALRPFTDADLLVPHHTTNRADSVMRQLGYIPKSAKMKYESGYGEQSYLHPERPGGNVEIHWNLVNSPSLRRGVSVEFDDLRFSNCQGSDGGRVTPSPGSLLLIAAVHAATSHCFDRLQWLCDVCQAVRGEGGEIDPEWLARTAQRTGSTLPLTAAIDLTGRILGEPKCGRLLRLCDLPGRLGPWGMLVTRNVVLRARGGIDSFRRNLFRQMLKRPR